MEWHRTTCNIRAQYNPALAQTLDRSKCRLPKYTPSQLHPAQALVTSASCFLLFTVRKKFHIFLCDVRRYISRNNESLLLVLDLHRNLIINNYIDTVTSLLKASRSF